MKIDMNEYDTLIAKFLDNDITLSEQELLEDWIRKTPENQKYFRDVAKTWEASAILLQDEELMQNKYKAFVEKHNRNKRKVFLRRTLSSAAAVIILLISMQLFIPLVTKSSQLITITSDAEKKEVVLPDGSTVWLNANSSLSYPSRFKKHRRAELSGEALFDIKQVNGETFLVSVENLTVEVLGTRFLVTERKEEGEIEAVLETGRINLILNETNEIIPMIPNEKLTYNISDGTSKLETVSAFNYTSWVESSLLFQNENLRSVFLQLEKWYGVQIECFCDELLDTPVSFTLDEEPLEETLEILKEITSMSWKINADNIITIE